MTAVFLKVVSLAKSHDSELIEEALREFTGTFVMVTHDAYFAERVGVTRRWEVGGGMVREA
jgi:ATPase subunit of ABC transporter with duplicated ATPase domains